MINKIIVATLSLVAMTASAIDLGVQGTTWDITETDFRQRLTLESKQVDWESINEEIAEDGKGFIDRQVKWAVMPTNADSIRLVDLTQRLTENLEGYRINDNGELERTIIFEKGHSFNPLQHFRPYKWFLVINGESQEQVAWMMEMENALPGRFVFMAVDGKLSSLIEKTGLPIAPTNPWIFTTAGVTHTPALVGVSASEPTLLTVAQFQAPYDTERSIEAMK